MSTDAIKWARDVRDIGGSAKLVLMMLAIRADEAGRAWPSIKTLAAQCCISRRTALAALAELKDKALLTWAHRANTSSMFHMPCLSEDERLLALAEGEVPPGISEGERVGADFAPTVQKVGAKSARLEVRNLHQSGAKSAHRINTEEQDEETDLFVTKPPRKNGKPSARKPKHFDTWYQRYPRKVGRGAAEKAYAKAVANGADERDLYRGLLTCEWSDDPSYIPHPATWLNAERWKDEPTKQPDDGYRLPGGGILNGSL